MFLKGYVRVFLVTQLLEVGKTGKLDHGGWSTHEDLRLLGGWGEVLRYHVRTHKPRAVLPACREQTQQTLHTATKYMLAQ